MSGMLWIRAYESRGAWGMVGSSKTSSVMSTSHTKPVQPIAKSGLKDSRLKQETPALSRKIGSDKEPKRVWLWC